MTILCQLIWENKMNWGQFIVGSGDSYKAQRASAILEWKTGTTRTRLRKWNTPETSPASLEAATAAKGASAKCRVNRPTASVPIKYFMTVADSKRSLKHFPQWTQTYVEFIFFKTENQRLGGETRDEPFLETSAIQPETQTEWGPFLKKKKKVLTRSLKPNWKSQP